MHLSIFEPVAALKEHVSTYLNVVHETLKIYG